jgi:predicted DNA-binding ribbon-helix-helix protein
MSTLSVRLPESLHKRLKEMADKEGVSMNQLITLAVSEKISTLLTVDYLKERAQKGDPKTFDQLLEKVPDTEPEEFDKL